VVSVKPEGTVSATAGSVGPAAAVECTAPLQAEGFVPASLPPVPLLVAALVVLALVVPAPVVPVVAALVLLPLVALVLAAPPPVPAPPVPAPVDFPPPAEVPISGPFEQDSAAATTHETRGRVSFLMGAPPSTRRPHERR